MKTWSLKFHRWLALAFGLPLFVVIFTGLILSAEPWLVTQAIEPGSLNVEKVQTLLGQYDPDGKARALFYRSYDDALTVSAGRGGGKVIDAATGEVLSGSSALASVMGASRRLHEALMLDAGWLVIASTAVMLVIVVLGALTGWPRIRNTVGGWHKAMAWGLLPLVVLSPLTALLMAAGVTFGSPEATPPAPQGAPLTLSEAVQVVGKDHDLSSLVWIRSFGGRSLARLAEDGEYRVYTLTSEDAVAQPRNWPRLWHEGNFAGAWSVTMNLVVSVAMLGLVVTGFWIWLRRNLRKRARRIRRDAPA